VQSGQFTNSHSGVHERFYHPWQLRITEFIEEGHQFLALLGIKVKALLFLTGRCSSVRDRVFKGSIIKVGVSKGNKESIGENLQSK
jgi:hypothetical protein